MRGRAGQPSRLHAPGLAPRRPSTGQVARLALVLALCLPVAACTLETKEDMEARSGDPLADVTGGVIPAADGGQAGAGAGGDGPAGDEDRIAVVGVAETVLRAITEADTTLMRQLMDPGAAVTGIAEMPDGQARQVSRITADAFIPGIGDPEQGFLERMWSPRVRVQGAIATVWAPYDFYVHGQFSHCGIDTFQLVRRPDGWRVAGLVYTRSQPPACELHPDGPPAR